MQFEELKETGERIARHPDFEGKHVIEAEWLMAVDTSVGFTITMDQKTQLYKLLAKQHGTH